jgi:hypothetical protein
MSGESYLLFVNRYLGIGECWNVYPMKQRKAFLQSRVSFGLACNLGSLL